MQVIYSAGTVTPMGSPRGSPISTPHGSPIFPGRFSPNISPRNSPRGSPRRGRPRVVTSPLTESSVPLINVPGGSGPANNNGVRDSNNHSDNHHHYHAPHMPSDDNDLKNTIPAMSRPLAITCVVCNIISPGLGKDGVGRNIFSLFDMGYIP